MTPGEHVVIVGGPLDALAARSEGLHLRDTLVILLPQGLVLTAFLFRVPLEGTVVENVLKHGCGGLWIDGCRIRSGTADLDVGRTRRPSYETHEGWQRPWQNEPASVAQHARAKQAQADKALSSGRWPTNLLLVHGSGCVRVGTQRVPAHTAFGRPGDSRGGILNKTGAARKNPHPGFADADGTETVSAWDCQPDCPVRMLDEMSGTTTNTRHMSYQRSGEGFIGSIADAPDRRWWIQETGTASRFYPQFSNLAGALDWLVRLIGGPQ